jgi:hypothetical protein
MAKRMKVHKDKGKLTAAGRRALPSKDFGLPGKGDGPEGKGSGSYPMPNKAHAIAAVGEAAAHASPAERAKIDAKAKRKFGVGASALHDHPRSAR